MLSLSFVLLLFIYYLLSKSNYGQWLFPSFFNTVKITLMFVERFICKIMCLINKFMEFKKEFWLLQALLKHSAPVDKYKLFEGMLIYFSGILTILKVKLFLLSKRHIWNLLLFILMPRSKILPQDYYHSLCTILILLAISPWIYFQILQHHWLHSNYQ